jgi:hypothetical protein
MKILKNIIDIRLRTKISCKFDTYPFQDSDKFYTNKKQLIDSQLLTRLQYIFIT